MKEAKPKLIRMAETGRLKKIPKNINRKLGTRYRIIGDTSHLKLPHAEKLGFVPILTQLFNNDFPWHHGLK